MDLWSLVPLMWQTELIGVKQHIDAINAQLEVVSTKHSVLPAQHQIFRALSCAPRDVRVIIIGQDPYPRHEHACGLSFSVPPGTTPLPPTLRNILLELSTDIGSHHVSDGDLGAWSEQGVLLLNRVLTVTEGLSNSHRNFGWMTVTEEIVDTVVKHNPDVPAILWGKQAQELQMTFQHAVVSAHPSPLSAYRGFFGSRPFSEINRILEQQGHTPISW
ncbi:MAG: uracil-DNA glycosylase [Actinomycetes bacterium]